MDIINDFQMRYCSSFQEQQKTRKKLKTQLSQQEAINNELAQRLEDEKEQRVKNAFSQVSICDDNCRISYRGSYVSIDF